MDIPCPVITYMLPREYSRNDLVDKDVVSSCSLCKMNSRRTRHYTCRETAPALGTASSGMRTPCLPSVTVRVARQTNHYGCELGWGGGILVRALLPGGDCCRVPSPHRGWGPSASVLLCPRTNFQLLAKPNLLLGRHGRGVAMATAMTMNACGRGRCVGLSVTG